MNPRALHSSAIRDVAIALIVLVVGACSSETLVSPRLSAAGPALGSKQSTTSSTMLFDGVVPSFAGDNVQHVFSMDDDGTNVRQLTPGSGDTPAWAPDGKRILFSDRSTGPQHISTMNSDGTGVAPLTAPPSTCEDFAAKALGKQVVFDRLCTTLDLYLVNADGSGLTLLAADIGGSPASSPKGDQVAYWHAGDIWLQTIATGARTNLTLSGSVPGSADPSFSPNGKQIVFTNGDIVIMNADGTGQAQLTWMGAVGVPRWSPDGKRVGFSSPIPGSSDIYVMNADGTGLVNVTSQSLGASHTAHMSAWAR
jgi:TolB protein